MDCIKNGWPQNKNDLKPEVKPSFSFRDRLTHHDAVLLKVEAVLIPISCRKQIKERLHSVHLGYDSMLRRAYGTVFWLGMNQDIKQLANKPRNRKLEVHKNYVKKSYDRHSLSKVKPQNKQSVYFRHRPNQTWKEEVVKEANNPNFVVTSTDDTSYRRHRDNVRSTTIPVNIYIQTRVSVSKI